MLVIRMQRTGRKGHAQFRVVVQDSRRTPSSGRIVANLGSFDPHTKQTTLNKEKAEQYLSNGAQPSDRVIRLLKAEKVKLPKWVKEPTVKKRELKKPEKLRKNQPAEVVEEAPVAEPEAPATEESAETATEEPTENEQKAAE
jgi:small subunit ribosomal protein S16